MSARLKRQNTKINITNKMTKKASHMVGVRRTFAVEGYKLKKGSELDYYGSE